MLNRIEILRVTVSACTALGYKMLYNEIIAVCSEMHKERTSPLSRQNVEFLNVKNGGTYSNYWASKG